MKVTDRTKSILAVRREVRDMTKAGWESVGEGGGKLWELHRGHRWNHRIIAAQIAVDGKSLWIKTERERGE